MRLACITIIELALQSWRRADPELRREPLAIADGKGTGARLVEVSDEARLLGVRLGMTSAQARAIAPTAVVKPVDKAREHAAREALVDAAFAVGARVEAEDDSVYVEIGDLGRLFPTEQTAARALLEGARAVGLIARVGVAASRGVARMVAWSTSERAPIAIAPSGKEAEHVAPFSVDALRPSVEARAALARWGVTTCGRLAALPPGEVAVRLGREGARLAELARGRGGEPLHPRTPASEIEEGLELDWAIAELEPLTFVVRGLVERVLERLAVRSCACAGVSLRLHLETGGYDVREVPIAAPTRELATLVELVRLAIAKRPPASPVVGVTLAGHAARGRTAQLDLFRPAGPAPDRLAATVARLSALVGEEHVGAVRAVDSWRDEELALAPFTPSPARATLEKSSEGVTRLVLRRFRPPRAVEVITDAGFVPRAIGNIGGVLVAAGPFRVRGEWWASSSFAREAWDVHAADGALYRLYRDEGEKWFLEGFYD